MADGIGLSSQLTGKLRQEDCKARLGNSMSSRELGETVSQNQKHKGVGCVGQQ